MSNLRLRTKFLFSLVATIACLSCATLLAVRYSGQRRARQEVVASVHTSLLTFDVLLHQHQQALTGKADLLATKAAMVGNGEDLASRLGLLIRWNSMGAIVPGVVEHQQRRCTS